MCLRYSDGWVRFLFKFVKFYGLFILLIKVFFIFVLLVVIVLGREEEGVV